jgi:ubiquinone biosynthesis protein COQ4
MEGGSFDAIVAAFENHPDGQALFASRPDTDALLENRIDLSRRPAGSFGRSYLDFLVPNGFDAADYADIAKNASIGFSADPQRTWLRNRVDVLHDVRHILTGYGADQLGETCLLVFRVGQVGHPGAAILAAAAAISDVSTHGPTATLKALSEAYRRGRSAVLVDLCPFEFDLSEPLESYRAKLGLTPPLVYQALLERKARRRLPDGYPAQAAGQTPSV